MIKNTLSCLWFVVFTCLGSTAWAKGENTCRYKNSGVNLDRIKNSSQVLGFEQIEKNARYAGNLKKVGGFYLELFSCTHYGARFTVMLGPDDDTATTNAALKALPDLLFSEADAVTVKNELKDVQLDSSTSLVFLDDLAKILGLTQAIVQVVEADGMGLLVFQFYGG
ncbi:MAG: hypothetical protein ACK5Q1_04630 [Limnobacter sp.]|jgi:hypothetical protein